MGRHPAAVAAASIALALVIANCRQIAGVHELTAASAVCASCANASCAAAASACRAAGPPCGARIACELACDPDDVACRAACASSAVGDAIADFDTCADSTCGAECAGACGDVLPVVPPSSAPACAACVASVCCGQAAACGASADCRGAVECARAASAPDVVVTCSTVKHAPGAAAYSALDDCVAGDCPAECAYGADWTCLGAVHFPTASAASITGTITIVDGSAQSDGVPGLQVRACDLLDEQCNAVPPLTPTYATDASGVATLTIPTAADEGSGFLGYFEVTDPSGTYFTTLVIPGFKLTQSGFAETVIAITHAQEVTLAQAIGKTFDPTLGYGIFTSIDCVAHTAPGMTLAIDNGDPSTVLEYTVDDIPTASTSHTDSSGEAIIGFIPPGAGVVTATNALGQLVSKTAYFTRAAALSIVVVPVDQ